MMKKYYLLLIMVAGCMVVRAQQTFRVIGYLRTQNILSAEANQVDYSRVTHINIAFINPDSTGNFEQFPNLKVFADKMHKQHVKVLASIGGGSAPAYYTTLLSSENRAAFIKKLVSLTEGYHLDGIDVDLEGERVDANYEGFITALSAALKSKNKLLTAAVATVYKDRYTDKALGLFDFISIMSYDKTGPWRPENPGPHAPYQMAVDDMNYWAGEKGIAKDKLNLGIPFYGYGFGVGAPPDMSFKGIIATYPGAENVDEVDLPSGGAIYYNGIPTVKNKTQLALQKAGGIMIWQLLQDATGANSLLGTVNTVIKSQSK
ncbi:MAG TPA: glycosyl hydrolase family 18 protein [Mucilaginibacter sp.]|nr:glycosyl hydrolase family 18 protein [Mucilaginibacter sp.]